MKNNYFFLIFSFLFLVNVSCNQAKKKLPIYGNRDIDVKEINGKQIVDTVFHQVPEFSFLNQEGQITTQQHLRGHLQVAYFFFTACPSICIDMVENMKYFQKKTEGIQNLKIVGFTIDPKRDSVKRLKEYVITKSINTRNWDLLTGDKESIYEVGERGYMATSRQDHSQPGGYLHSGQFILIDQDGHVRGMYDADDVNNHQVDLLISDIKTLIEND